MKYTTLTTTLLLTTLLAVANLAQAAEKKHLVIVKSLQKPIAIAQAKTLEQQINTLSDNGFSPYLIQTDDYPPLRKGLRAIVLGPFDAETAKTKQQYVQTWVKDAYIRAVNPPVAKQAQYGFTTLKTAIDKKHCITLMYDEDMGQSTELCQGLGGYRTYNTANDGYNSLNFKKAGVTSYFGFDGGFSYFIRKHPLTWIYKDKQLVALSAVMMEDKGLSDVKPTVHRFLTTVGKQQFCLVNKHFKIKDINEVLTYLNDNPSNCP